MNRYLKKTYCTDAINNNVDNSKSLWSTIKKLIPKHQSSIQSVHSEQGNTVDDKDTANQFNDFFTSIGSKLASKFNNVDHSNLNQLPEETTAKFDFDVITPEFVFDEISKMSNKKSPGLDNLNVKMLKLAAPIVCDSLAYICNISLWTSTFPFAWKKAKVTPIHKDGDKCDVNNYRPISVLPIVSKVIERAVHNQLYSYLTCNNLLNSCQSGFRKSHSTYTTLPDVSDFILNNMTEGKVTGALFINLKRHLIR